MSVFDIIYVNFTFTPKELRDSLSWKSEITQVYINLNLSQ